ncbi:zinc ribbon domain-containing protein [Candidatus Gottesmanbacteria bacterium]|nr:zinc ribbon domain-containing protein [Candidatus Gottesmanbacteria bacterium]
MEVPITICPQCHAPVRPTDFYCYNCGKNLHPAPPSTRLESLAFLFLGSIFVPIVGIFWAWPYLKRPDLTSRIIGTIAILLNVLATFITFKIVADIYFATLNSARSLQNLNGL